MTVQLQFLYVQVVLKLHDSTQDYMQSVPD